MAAPLELARLEQLGRALGYYHRRHQALTLAGSLSGTPEKAAARLASDSKNHIFPHLRWDTWVG